MATPVKKSLKHKLNDALASTSTAKKLRVSKDKTQPSQDDSGIGKSVSSKKKVVPRKKTKSATTSSAKRRLTSDSTSSWENMNVSEMGVSELLALGEGNGGQPVLSNSGMSSNSSDSEGGEWEEVGESKVLTEPVIPMEGVDIIVDAPLMSFKRKKREMDLEAEVKRQLKRRQKEIQELMHKVHLLCWIAHIKFVNLVLNSETLLALSISLVTSKNIHPPKRADCDYLERVVNWFSKTITIPDEVENKSKPGLLKELSMQFQLKYAFSNKELTYMFIVFLRSLGLQCRLVSSIVAVPLKPSEKVDGNSSKKRNSVDGSDDETVNLVPKRKVSSKVPDVEDNQNKKKKSSTSNSRSLKSSKKGVEVAPTGSNKDVSRSMGKSKKNTVTNDEPLTKRGKKSLVSLHGETAGKIVLDTKEEPSAARPVRRTRGKATSMVDLDSEEEFSLHFKETNSVRKSVLKGKKNVFSVKERRTDSAPLKEIRRKGVSQPKSSPSLDTPSTSKSIPMKGTKIKEEKHKSSPSLDTPSTSKSIPMKGTKIKKENDSDDDFTPVKKTTVRKTIDRRVLSSGETSPERKRQGQDTWVEVFLEAEEKWITVDIVKKKIHCIKQLYSRATQPVVYVIACNNDSTLKDVTKRYVPNWHSDTRKRRVNESWWQETLWPYLPPTTAREKEEDEDIAKQLQDMPLPTNIAEFKFHPLYALKRHLLKFEGIFPPEAPPIGYIRKEPVYARECVVTLRSRDIWYKEARVVRRDETPYKIVKSRPKYDKMTGEWRKDLPLELFGVWQTEEFMPPIAVDGKVPRNEYGNVDLFKACMLPIGTVHLQVPALNRVARKLGIDCAPAIVGFEFHSGGSHPVQDGFVVCEEFKDKLMDAWNKEIDESAKRSEEKREKRVYGNWRRLIRGLLIREKLKIKYAFNENEQVGSSSSTQYLSVQKEDNDSSS